MRKRLNLEGLDCANCASKMETSIKNIEGVNDCTISFMTQKMVLDYNNNYDFLTLKEDIQKAISKIDKNCEIVS